MKIRGWLGAAAAAILGATGAASAAPPNIVVLLADDMRWDAMGCAGNPVLKTPALDRLASRGMRFRNAFVTTSICAISRASILTGQYARRHGVGDFATPVRGWDATYPAQLRKAGYYTGFIGKWGTAQNSNAWFVASAQRFDFWAGDMQQTIYWHDRTCNYVTNNGTSGRTNFFCSCPAAARATEGVGPKGGPHPALKDPVHAETGFVPAKIRSFLDQRDPAKPFCLSVSFKAPHGPWIGFAPRFDRDFEGVAVPRRPNATLAEALRQPEFLRASLESARGMQMASDDSLDGVRNRLMRQYYRLIEGLDVCVGGLLGELERRGLSTNTVVIFTSDNGHFSGEHGLFGKWLMHEESIRVPLLLADLRAPASGGGRTCDAMALNIDIAPTVLDLAGVPAPAVLQGRSLRPLLQDPAAPFRDAFFYEHLYGHGPRPPNHIERSEGLRTADWKYTMYVDQQGPQREELYHLATDPYETNNLAAAPACQERLRQMRAQVMKSRKELK